MYTILPDHIRYLDYQMLVNVHIFANTRLIGLQSRQCPVIEPKRIPRIFYQTISMPLRVMADSLNCLKFFSLFTTK